MDKGKGHSDHKNHACGRNAKVNLTEFHTNLWQDHMMTFYVPEVSGQRSSTPLWHHKMLSNHLSDLNSTPWLRNRRGGCDHISHWVRYWLENVMIVKICSLAVLNVKHLLFRICLFFMFYQNQTRGHVTTEFCSLHDLNTLIDIEPDAQCFCWCWVFFII